MKNNKAKKVSFLIQSEDIRHISGNALNHILERFKARYLKNVELISSALTFEKGKDVLEAIEKMIEDLDKTSQEFEGVAPLFMEIEDTVDKPVMPNTLPPASA